MLLPVWGCTEGLGEADPGHLKQIKEIPKETVSVKFCVASGAKLVNRQALLLWFPIPSFLEALRPTS